MSIFVDTPFGKLRKIKGMAETQHPEGGPMSSYMHECPHCKEWGGLSQKQLEGAISIFCKPKGGCPYHETHDFRPYLNNEYFA